MTPLRSLRAPDARQVGAKRPATPWWKVILVMALVIAGLAAAFGVLVHFVAKAKHDREPAEVHALERHFASHGVRVAGTSHLRHDSNVRSSILFEEDDAKSFWINRYAPKTASSAQGCSWSECVYHGDYVLIFAQWAGDRDAVRKSFLALP